MTKRAILDEIYAATEPSVMTKPEAAEFISSIIAELEGNLEALRDEMDDDT